MLAITYITGRRIDSAAMELEVWKINHAGRPAGPARSGLFRRYRYRSEKNLTGYNYNAKVIECIAITKERNFIIDASKFDDQDRKRAALV